MINETLDTYLAYSLAATLTLMSITFIGNIAGGVRTYINEKAEEKKWEAIISKINGNDSLVQVENSKEQKASKPNKKAKAQK